MVALVAACGSTAATAPVAEPSAVTASPADADNGSAGYRPSAQTDRAAVEAESGAGSNGGPAIRPLPPADGVPVATSVGPQPIAIEIPELGVDGSAVRPVGVEPNGEYEVPIASEVGWYRFGSAPGETGSAVLAGHIAYDGRDGVFRNLASVEVGSSVDVALDDGTSISYRIVDVATYEKTALPFDDIFSESGPDRLVLITCGGEFNPSERSYESNVVAYAEPVG